MPRLRPQLEPEAWSFDVWLKSSDNWRVVFFAEGAMDLQPVIVPVPEGGYVGYVVGLPGANTQGETLEEVRENLAEAIELIFAANPDLTDD